MTRKKGFTLIELLIVVAIIAILAAIAVPNFLEAQTRAKVSRVHSDQRVYATALESYRIDNNGYPPISFENFFFGLVPLSTPVSYITDAFLEDPFGNRQFQQVAQDVSDIALYQYFNHGITAALFLEAGLPFNPQIESLAALRWVILSPGPFRRYHLQVCLGPPREASLAVCLVESAFHHANGTWVYDPTNGTVSIGEIRRYGTGQEKGNYKPIQ